MNRKNTKKYQVLIILLFVFGSLAIFGQNYSFGVIKEQSKQNLLSNILSLPVNDRFYAKYLNYYPFSKNDGIQIAEGYSEYDGNLFDKPGEIHWGIDYVKKVDEDYVSFMVYASHSGTAVKGYGKTWGNFVVVRFRDGNGAGFNTLYSHLKDIPKNIPFYVSDFNNDKGVEVGAGDFIGNAGTTGNTKGLNQLHFELQVVSGDSIYRVDPYGVYDRLSSGKYRQPGQSLIGLRHYWVNNLPDFAKK